MGWPAYFGPRRMVDFPLSRLLVLKTATISSLNEKRAGIELFPVRILESSPPEDFPD